MDKGAQILCKPFLRTYCCIFAQGERSTSQSLCYSPSELRNYLMSPTKGLWNKHEISDSLQDWLQKSKCLGQKKGKSTEAGCCLRQTNATRLPVQQWRTSTCPEFILPGELSKCILRPREYRTLKGLCHAVRELWHALSLKVNGPEQL